MHPSLRFSSLRPVILTRRQFVAGATALGVAPIASRAVAQPKSGGRLRMGLGEAQITDTLDPAILSTPIPQFLSMGVTRNCLVELGAARRLTQRGGRRRSTSALAPERRSALVAARPR